MLKALKLNFAQNPWEPIHEFTYAVRPNGKRVKTQGLLSQSVNGAPIQAC